MRAGYRWKGRVLQARHGESEGLRPHGSPAGVVRKGLLQGSRRVRHGDREGDHARLPQAGQAVPPRRQPGHRGPLQGDLGRLRRARRRRPSARSTTRSAVWDRRPTRSREPAAGPAAGRAGLSGRSGPTISPICSAGSSTPAAGPRPRAAAPHRAPAGRGPRGRAAPVLPDDAVNGVTTTVNLTSDAACSTCGGTGAAPGPARSSAPTCGGRGVVNDNQGLFSFSQPCRGLRRHRHAGRDPVPDLPRRRRRAPGPPGQGPHPRRGRERPAHPDQGPRRRRGQRWAAGRLVCGGAHRPPRGLRPPRQEPDPDRPPQLPRGGPRRHHHRAHPGQAGHAEDPGRDQVGPDVPGQGPRRAGVERGR